jgi:hypothetical protein
MAHFCVLLMLVFLNVRCRAQALIKRERSRRAKARLAENPAGLQRRGHARVVPMVEYRFAQRLDVMMAASMQTSVPATARSEEIAAVSTQAWAPATVLLDETTALSTHPAAAAAAATTAAAAAATAAPAVSAVRIHSGAFQNSLPVATLVVVEAPVLAARRTFGRGAGLRL